MGNETSNNGARGNRMEERPSAEYLEEEIDLGKYWSALRPNLWKVALISLGVGVVTLVIMLRMPNIYRATAVIAPPVEDRPQNASLGMLASFGFDFGNPVRVEELETLFKSDDLTVRVFRKHNLWPIIYGNEYDPKTERLRNSGSFLSGNEKDRKPLGDWDAIREAKGSLRVSVNRRANTMSVSFESPSPEGSANIVGYFLEEGKNRLQEEALARATTNKKFIQEQIGKTLDALTRDRLYSLYGQEVEKEMMARNREQFGFRVIDAPRVPDRKSGPRRILSVFLVFMVGFLVFSIVIVVRGPKKTQ